MIILTVTFVQLVQSLVLYTVFMVYGDESPLCKVGGGWSNESLVGSSCELTMLLVYRQDGVYAIRGLLAKRIVVSCKKTDIVHRLNRGHY